MSEHIRSAISLLRVVRQETDAIGVAVSFGKDSLATLDLCCRVFPRLEAYYLYRVRDLAIVQGWADEVKARCGVTVRMYPHFDLVRCYRNHVLQPNYRSLTIPRVKILDIEGQFRRDAAVDWIAMGWRRTDSHSRALILKSCGGIDAKARRVFPLRVWRRQQVYDYLAERNIPLPEGFGRKEQGGLDFHPGALRELRDNHREDWQRFIVDFPFAEAMLVADELQKNPANPSVGGAH